MFNSQKVQICQLHESQICIGFCVSINCSSNSIYCYKCLEQFHEDHIDSCREFGQITKDLSNSIKQKEDHFNKTKEKQIQLHQLSRHQIDAYQEKIDELRNIQRNFQKKKYQSLSNQEIKILKEQCSPERQLDNCKFQQGLVNEITQMEHLVQSLELRNKDCLINEKKSKLIKCIMKWLYIGGYWGISIIVIYLQIYVFMLGGCLLYVIHIELFNEWQPKQNQTYIELIQNQAQYFDIVNKFNIAQANDLYLMENYEESIIYYDKAIHLQQGNASSYFYKGNALTKLKFFEAAVANYNKYLKINSEKDAVYLNKGYALTQMKLFDQAIECYDLAIKINFHNDEAYYKKGKSYQQYRYKIIGIVLHQVDRYLEALDSYNKAININSNNQLYYFSKGLTLHKLQEYYEAIQAYDFALLISINDEIQTHKSIISQISDNSLLNIDKIHRAEESKTKDPLLDI